VRSAATFDYLPGERMDSNSLVTAGQLASYIDHTLLNPAATAQDIEKLCAEAEKFRFFSVCVNGSWVPLASRILSRTGIKVASVVGFPLGASSSDVKCFETESAIRDGAREIDVVINLGRLWQGDDRYVVADLTKVVKAAGESPVKAIIECCLLSDEKKICACRLAVDSGARFVKTSTGFSTGGATIADVKLMRETVGPNIGVKASGGIRDARTAIAMIEAGATRLGTSSGVAILREFESFERGLLS
jgi:deoxyribose-phosphate aldolase